MSADIIASRANELVKRTRALSEAKTRRETGLHFIEGDKLVREALSSGMALMDVFFEEGASDGLPPDLPAETRLHAVTRPVMEALCESKTPQRMCASVQSPALTPPARYPDGLVVVLDAVQDPGNVGTILRTADALGAAAVLLGAGTADAFSGKTLRAAMGSTYHLPLYAGDAAAALAQLNAQGFCCVCGHLAGSGTLPAPGKRAALVIGNEGNGVSDELAGMADVNIKIPMAGHLESLNASVAAGILMYEAQRCKTKSIKNI